MKRRLHQPPLPPMHLLLGRQQPLAKNDLRPLEDATLVKRPMLRHEQLANQIGMIEKEDLLRPDMKLRRIAVLLREFLKKRNRIALESSEVAERDSASRSWGSRHVGVMLKGTVHAETRGSRRKSARGDL